jgi:hypothetical protein
LSNDPKERRRAIGKEEIDNTLTSGPENVPKPKSYYKGTAETIGALDIFSKKMKTENAEKPCEFEDSCFISRSKMGRCPCECYR